MYKVVCKTWAFILFRFIIYILLSVMQLVVAYKFYEISKNIFYQLNNNLILLVKYIAEPLFIVIGISFSCLFNKYIICTVMYILSLIYVIAVTTVILEIKYKGSLIVFSLKEYKKYFLSLTASSVISISTIKLLKKIKNSIFNKDILPKFKESKNKFYQLIIKLFTSDIKLLLNMLDEIIVSYVWFTTYMYDKYSENKKTSLNKVQSKFFLESIGFIFKIFPSLLIDSFGYNTLFFFINKVIFTLILFPLLILFNFNVLFIIFIFVFNSIIKSFITEIIIYNFRICAIIYSFYKNLNNVKDDTNINFKDIVNKVPELLKFANIAKMEEFNDYKVDNKSELSLIDIDNLSESLYKEINRVGKYFLIKEKDILKSPAKKKDNNKSDKDNKEKEEVKINK